MKLTGHFKAFLEEIVDINQTRLDQLDASAEAIITFIRKSAWPPRIRGFLEQGSWAHGTIIKPLKDKAFDADLLVYVDPVEGWEAKNYVDELYKQFKASGTYGDKVRRYSHCVTIEYACERKLDIAPCVKGREKADVWEVCNRATNEFELSNPRDYTEWLKERNRWSGGNTLRKVTRLLKFQRDIKTTFTCPSFLLTTLLGLMVIEGDTFTDVPTALVTIVRRLDDALQKLEEKPEITNPVLDSEVISDAWTDDQYSNFRDKVHTYREWIDDAYNEADRDESIGKWRRVFGDGFAAGIAIETAASVSKTAADELSKVLGVAIGAAEDLVSLVKRYGARVIPASFRRLPHMERPTWRWSDTRLVANVTATLHNQQAGPSLGQVHSLQALRPGQWLKFNVRNQMGAEYGADFDVKWRITNTDQAARRAGQMRGGFERSTSGTCRWEKLEYHGVHMAEAFVIRRRDGRLVAQSEPFYVMIE